MSRAYSSEFDPPAILLTATLSGVVHSRPRLTLPALIDTARLSVDSLGVQEIEVAPSAAFYRLGPRLAAILLPAAQWAGASV